MKVSINLTQDLNHNLNQVVKIANINPEAVNIPFFQTPFFRRWMATEDMSDLVTLYLTANYIRNVHFISCLWKDTPIDYFQNFHEILKKFELYNVNGNVNSWLSENLNSYSYLHMISQYYSKNKYQTVCEIYLDTMNQLSKLIQRKAEITPPNRWRLMDFHDHMSHLYMKSTVENKTHNNEFIPFPVKVNNYKIYQPKDTMELALWGKKVRNCVLSYEDKIIHNRSAIVLIEENETPKYTVELDYESLKKGNLNIRQSVGIANTALSDEQRSLCTELLSAAIQK